MNQITILIFSDHHLEHLDYFYANVYNFIVFIFGLSYAMHIRHLYIYRVAKKKNNVSRFKL